MVLPVPKLFFGYARDMTALFTFGVGAAGVVFPERTTPERIFELIERHRPTILVQVPTMMNAMARSPGSRRLRPLLPAALRLLRRGAARRGASAVGVERFGVEVLDGVGSSEAYHIYISNRPARVRPGSVGQIVPGLRGADRRRGWRGPARRRARRAVGHVARARRGATGTTRRDRSGRSRATGSAPATSSSATPTATSGTAAAPTTCSRWVGSGSLRSRSRTACSRHPRGARVRGRRPREGRAGRASRVRRRDDGGRRPCEELAVELIGHVRSELSPHKCAARRALPGRAPEDANGKVDRKALSEGRHVP